ncbi:MAG: hypothetical protein RQM92_14645 [Candidatus Syntrophopropionicum ammoniitolerans]
MGIASSILGTVRNTGMAIGIALAGLVLYSLTPPAIMVQEHLSGLGAVSFLGGCIFLYASQACPPVALFLIPGPYIPV